MDHLFEKAITRFLNRFELFKAGGKTCIITSSVESEARVFWEAQEVNEHSALTKLIYKNGK